MTTITYKRDGMTMLTPCPHGRDNFGREICVGSCTCSRCRHNHGITDTTVDCNFHAPSAPCDCRTAAARMSADKRGCKI